MSQVFDKSGIDKLGIYDLVAVWLSGICITVFSLLADQVIFQSRLSDILKVEDTIPFLVISYFIGLAFQELSSIIQKEFTYRTNNLLSKALKPSNTSHQFLTPEEKEGIVQAVQTELALQTPPNDHMIYNYCKFYLISTGNTTRADKDQSTFGMSRSLSLYFLGLSFFTAYSAIRTQNIMHIVYTVVIFVLSMLFYYRCIRFAKMRYIYIVRSFYYSFLQNKAKKIAKDSTIVSPTI